MDERVAVVLRGVSNPEDILEAISRKDVSYIRGVIQWYDRKGPPNEKLLPFLRGVLKLLSSPPSASSSSSDAASESPSEE